MNTFSYQYRFSTNDRLNLGTILRAVVERLLSQGGSPSGPRSPVPLHISCLFPRLWYRQHLQNGIQTDRIFRCTPPFWVRNDAFNGTRSKAELPAAFVTVNGFFKTAVEVSSVVENPVVLIVDPDALEYPEVEIHRLLYHY